MTNRLGRLERAGLVERRPDPNDRRGKLIALTSSRRTTVDELLGRHVANEQRLLAAFSPEEQEMLSHLLERLIAAI